MKKEYWFEEMRLTLRAIKRARTIEQVIVARREFENALDALFRIFTAQAGFNVTERHPPKLKFFARLLVWIKSIRQIFG